MVQSHYKVRYASNMRVHSPLAIQKVNQNVSVVNILFSFENVCLCTRLACMNADVLIQAPLADEGLLTHGAVEALG